MSESQLGLFDGPGFRTERKFPRPHERPRLDPAALDDEALAEAIRGASMRDCHDLAREAARRRLAAAIPALEALCRRFKGFGPEREIAEQVAALEGLAAIGGIGAAGAVMRIIAGEVVQGPGLEVAAGVAARLGVVLPDGAVLPLLRHRVPEVRASACRCVRVSPVVIPVLVELLEDLNRAVAAEAAYALGRMGRVEGRPALVRALRESPSAEAIDAVSAIADDDCFVLLGRIARTNPDLAEAVLAALDAAEQPRAAQIAASVRNTARGGEA